MADPNISKHSIEEVKDAISRRLASHPPSVGDADASVGQEAINEQNKVLSRRELTKGIFALLIAGHHNYSYSPSLGMAGWWILSGTLRAGGFGWLIHGLHCHHVSKNYGYDLWLEFA